MNSLPAPRGLGVDFHLGGLLEIAAAAQRPLRLIVRGGLELLPRLRAAFRSVTVLETLSFMKTMKRQRIELREDGRARWRSAPTPRGAPVDALIAINRAGVRRLIEGPALPALPEPETADA
jgi:hypothetical protein